MDYEGFKQSVKEGLEALYGEHMQVEIQSILKNNSLKKDGVLLHCANQACAPTVYLDDYYEEFQKGASIGAIVGEISAFYTSEGAPFDVSFFGEYSLVQPNIVMRLVNMERNPELLKEVPYVRYLDMAILFVCKLEHESLGSISILIHRDHMKMWKKNVVDLYAAAIKNAPVLQPCQLCGMSEVLEALMNQKGREAHAQLIQREKENPMMYVLSNESGFYGAACILYPGVLEKFSIACDSDFYIIPSSVHEVILVPAEDPESMDSMRRMVKMVNESEVPQEEILSDSIYYYSRKLKKILF